MIGDHCQQSVRLDKYFLPLWNLLKNLGAPRGTILKNRINILITPAQAIGHKTLDLETYFSNSSEIRQKNDEFLKETDSW